MDKRKVLVVDKDHDLLMLVRRRLEARGYIVLSCDTSDSALRLVVDEIPDLILLDSQMETIKGHELSRAIKKTTHNFFIPIIMMAESGHIAEQIMGMHRGFDDIMIKPFNSFEMQLRIDLNLKRIHESIQANPLTKLPGNIAIEHRIKECIVSGNKFSVCYLDIDNFKSFNDAYGFDKGDDVIVQTSRIILRMMQRREDKHAFVGHVGGDDFVVILDPADEETFAHECIEQFDRLIPTHYTQSDREQRYIQIKNRRGVEEQFPLMSISIAAVTNMNRSYSNPGEIAQTAAEVKKFLKTQEGSNYLRDRREQPLNSITEAHHVLQAGKSKKDNTEPLGQMLLRAGLITSAQLQEALKKHFSTGQRLGRILINMKAISAEKVGQMLEQKLGVPYISLVSITLSAKMLRLFTADYMKAHGVVPFQSDDKQLSVAMIDPFDLKTIDDIEQMTKLKVFPYIALEEEFSEFVEKTFGETL